MIADVLKGETLNNLKSLPLKIFLPLVILVIFSFMFISMMTYQYYAQISNLEQTSLATVKQRLAALQGELEEEFSEYGNYQHGERAVSEFGLILETRSLAILNENNRILLATKYRWKRQQAEDVIPDFDVKINNKIKLKQRPLIFFAHDRMSIKAYYPVRLFSDYDQLRSSSTGTIFFDYDLSMARAQICNRIMVESAIFAIVGVLFMVVLISLINTLVGRPIQYMSETTLRLANGELGIQLDEYGQGELGVLGRVFNKMSTQIEENITKLRRSERNLSITLDSIGDAVIVTNALGEITRMNSISATLTGWLVEDAIGRPLGKVFNIISAVTREPVDDPVSKVLRTRTVVELSNHTALIAKDGSEYQIADSAAPIVGITGKINGVILVFRDVSEEYALQSALRESEARFRALVETTADWIWEVDSHGCYTYVSPRCFEILGYHHDELIGKTPFDLMPANEAKRVEEEFLIILKEKRTFTGLENINLHKKGHSLILETSGVPFFDQKGELLGYRGVDRDITKRKREEEALRLTNNRFRTLIDYAPEAVMIFDPDNMLFDDVNQNALDLFGMSQEAFLESGPADISPPFQSNNKSTAEAVKEHIKEIEDGRQSTFEWLHKDSKGNVFPCEVRLVRLPSVGRKLIRASIIDISMRKKTEEALAESENRFRQLFEQIPNIAVQGYDKDRNVIFWNMASEKLYGFTKEEALGVNIDSLIIPDKMIDQVVQAIKQWITKGIPIPAAELELQHKDGSKVFVLSSHIMLNNAEGDPEMYCIDIDLSERRKAQAKIEQLAYFDELTKLPNRRLFLDRLNEERVVVERHSICGAILYMDLDNFKTINDSLGHSFGDAVLQQVSRRIQGQIRTEDTLSRFGGDEFVVLLKDLSENHQAAVNQARFVAEKIQNTFSQPIDVGQHELFITLSIGISLFSGEDHNAAELLKRADTAMYRAKEVDRNAIRFFEPSMQVSASIRLMLEKDLRLALLREEFFLSYQPQVNLTGKLIGVEALLRWNHPVRGVIFPGEFISVAEETGIILQIGAWVLKTACEQLSFWKESYQDKEFHVAINVSPHQFRMGDFVFQVEREIERFGIDPARLTLEVTESIVIHNIKDTVKKMHALKKRGLHFSIDDFGTGYSSLSYLKRLPLDQLKIDQSFVRDINQDSNDEAIVETIITMAHILGLNVVAEGVEKQEQINFLTRKGCKIFQGYYFDKPLSPEKIVEKLG